MFATEIDEAKFGILAVEYVFVYPVSAFTDCQ
jgi:hypothetical protein